MIKGHKGRVKIFTTKWSHLKSSEMFDDWVKAMEDATIKATIEKLSYGTHDTIVVTQHSYAWTWNYTNKVILTLRDE